MIKSSVIIPAKNEQEYLSDLLESLLDQTVDNYEIIVVVDAAAPNETVEIAQSFSEKSSKIEYVINHDRDAGLSREQGVNLANGEYLLFTDADCVVPKDWIEKMEYYLERGEPSIGAIGGPNLPFPNSVDGERLVSFAMDSRFATWGAKASTQWVLPSKMCFVDHIPFCNVAMRKETHDIVGKIGYDSYYSDNDYTFRMKRHNLKLLFVPDLYVYHHREKSLKAVFRKMITYGVKRARLIKKFPETSKLYLLPLAIPFVVVTLILLSQLVLLGLMAVCYLLFTIPTVASYYQRFKNLGECIKLPFVFVAVHLGYAIGLLEIFRKLRRKDVEADVGQDKRAMNVIQVTPVFPPHIGGVENYVLNISKQLVKLGHKVVVYTTNLPKWKAFEIIEGVVVHRLPVLFYMFNIPITLFLSIFREKAEIIHVHIPPPTGALSSLVFMGKLKKTPVILTYHNDTIGDGLIERFLAKLYSAVQDGFLLKNATQITVPSVAYKKKLLARGLSQSKIKVIPGGIDSKQIETNHTHVEIKRLREKYDLGNRRLVLFVGALESRKGVEYLIRATPRITRQLTDVKIAVVGDGRLRDKLRRLARELVVDSSVSFVGQVTARELNLFYEAASVFVLPSMYETFGLVLAEAMAHSKPVIATRIPGVSDLIEDGHNGILVEPRDPEGIAIAVMDILSDEALADRLAENGRDFASKYSWKEAALKMLCIYKKTLRSS